MARKIALIGILILALAASGAYAHERGDLALNIEPQMGAVFPAESLMENDLAIGMGMSLRTTLDYYLLDFLAVNAGVGIGFNHHMFKQYYYSKFNPTDYVIYLAFWPFLLPQILGTVADFADGAEKPKLAGEFHAVYLIIPFGLRFSKYSFTMGAGATANIPLNNDDDYRVYRPQYDPKYETQDNISFKLLPYMGWYVDIGFDLPNKKRSKNAFGMLARLNGAFNKEIAEPEPAGFFKLPPEKASANYAKRKKWIDNYRFNFISLDLVFKFSIGLAKLPIGGKKDQVKEN